MLKCPEPIRRLFEDRFPVKALPKKHTLLHQGEISTQAFLVETGCLRMWYNDDGKDVTVKFYTAGDVVSSLESFYLGVPSLFGLETVIPSTVRVCGKSDFDEILGKSAEFRDQMLDVAVRCMADYQKLFLNRIMHSPEERYRAFLQSEPNVFDLVPQHYIASYLGVTPVSLSRIRNKISQR